MSWLSRLFGTGGGAGGSDAAPAAETEEYKGFRITPEPIPEGGQFRLAARIEAETEDGETRHHHLIRADMLRDRDEAETAALRKARQMIDQQGMRLFD